MIEKLNNCCGCSACCDVCPSECIKMIKHNDGFLYPKVDDNKCIDCGMCNKVCPCQHDVSKKHSKSGYAAFAINPISRKSGSSGGIFGTIAEYVISKDGVVFGAGFDENLQLRQYCASTVTELERMYKSKYLQCNMNDFYKNVKRQLDAGNLVLVCNTPCNISALQNYLKKDYPNLYLLDFVCHGVPSQDFFNKNIKWYKQKKKIDIIEYNFREKTKHASTPHLFKIKYKRNGSVYSKTDLYIKDPFYNAFQKRLSLRESCYNCIYAEERRVSDITLGDFHDIGKIKKGYDRMAGVSMVLVNSEKGIRLFERIKHELNIIEVETKVLADNNECLKTSTVKPKNREQFLGNLNQKGVNYLVSHELKALNEWKKLLYYKMPDKMRKQIKKIVLGEE